MNMLPTNFESLLNSFSSKFPNDIVWYYQYPFSLHNHLNTILRPPMDWFCQAVAEQGWKPERAKQIYNKMFNLLSGLECKNWDPVIIFSLTDEQLTKQVGYSKPKAETIRQLASFWMEHSIEEIKHLNNDQIIELLSFIKGIGIWTINYWLSHQLCRKVIWIEDRLPRIGLQFILDLPKLPTIKEAKNIVQQRWGEYAYFGVMILFQIGHFKHYSKNYFNF